MKQTFNTLPEKIKINVHINGLSLTNSYKSEFWLILGSICVNLFHYIELFVIGIHHGKSKPENSNDFLRSFDEMKEIEENGLKINNKIFSVNINAILYDTPTLSYVYKIKGHNAYEECFKCIQEGHYIENRIIFPEIKSSLRTDESFRSKQYPDHYTGTSCLEELKINMILTISTD